MKNPVEGLKKVDFKQVGLQHGEKLVLGLVALFILAAWLGSNWTPYDRRPEELDQRVTDAGRMIENAPWKEEDQGRYAVPAGAFPQRVAKALSPVNAKDYEFGTDYFFSPARKLEKYREPRWYPVNDMIADPVRFFYLLPREEPDYFVDRPAGPPGAIGPVVKTQPGEIITGPQSQVVQPDGIYGPQEPPPGNADPTLDPRGQQPVQSGRGARGVAVRGWFPLRQQLDEVARSRNVRGLNADTSWVTFKDFEILRQAAVPGPDPWSGPWETLDVTAARNFVEREVAEWSEEVVDHVITELFTMPFPQLAAGTWGELLTHPKVRDYHMTAEAKRQEEAIELEIRRLNEQEQLRIEEQEPGGFAGARVDMRGLRQRYLTDPTISRDIYRGAARSMNPNDPDSMKFHVRAAGNVLLFRFLDLNVQPGETYRYKVRLQLWNPNRNLTLDTVAAPEVIEGTFRYTDWSDPTAPVAVPGDVQYFMARSRSRASQPVATFDVFQWFADIGTTGHTQIKAEPGSIIGDKQVLVDVVNPLGTKGPWEKQKKDFRTADVLVDMARLPVLAGDLHSDLGLDGNKSLRVVDRALVADGHGNFVEHDPKSSRSGFIRAVDNINRERKYFLKPEFASPVGEGDDLDAMAAQQRYLQGAGGGDPTLRGSDPTLMQDPTLSGGGGRPRGTNTLRQRRRPR